MGVRANGGRRYVKCRLSLAGPMHSESPGVKLPLADAPNIEI